MNRVNSVLKLQWRALGTWIGILWLIVAVSFASNIVMAALITNSSFTTGGMWTLHVGALIAGIAATAQTFPFAVGLGVRRTDFFVGTLAMATLFHAGTALMLTLLATIESRMSGIWGGQVNFFYMKFLGLSPLRLFALHFTLLMALFTAGYFCYAIFSRYLWLGMAVSALATVVLFSVALYLIGKNNAWPQAIAWLANVAAWPWRLVPVTLLFSLLSYWMIRRSTV